MSNNSQAKAPKYRMYVLQGLRWVQTPIGKSIPEAIEKYKAWGKRPATGASVALGQKSETGEWVKPSDEDFHTFKELVLPLPEVFETRRTVR